MKVLIISPHPLSSKLPESVTFVNLFSQFKRDELIQIVLGERDESLDLVQEWRCIGAQNVRADRFVRSVLNRFNLHKESNTLRDTVKEDSSKQILLTAYADIMPISFPQEVKVWLKQLKPQAIYAVPGSVRSIRTILWAKSLLDVPIVIHYMDDWQEMRYNRLLTAIPRAMLLNLNRKMIRLAAKRLTISPQMSEHYKKVFGLEFEDFMNCVEVRTKQHIVRHTSEIKLSFIGGLHLYRNEVLEKLGLVIQFLNNAQNALKYTLDCYAPAHHLRIYEDGLSRAGINCKLIFNASEVEDVTREYDCLVHVESFDTLANKFLRYSISTKIPFYLAAGIPLFVIGPEHLASINYVCLNGAAIGVFDLDYSSIVKGLNMLADRNVRQKIGESAYKLALSNHDRNIVSKKFRNVFEVVTQNK